MDLDAKSRVSSKNRHDTDALEQQFNATHGPLFQKSEDTCQGLLFPSKRSRKMPGSKQPSAAVLIDKNGKKAEHQSSMYISRGSFMPGNPEGSSPQIKKQKPKVVKQTATKLNFQNGGLDTSAKNFERHFDKAFKDSI